MPNEILWRKYLCEQQVRAQTERVEMLIALWRPNLMKNESKIMFFLTVLLLMLVLGCSADNPAQNIQAPFLATPTLERFSPTATLHVPSPVAQPPTATLATVYQTNCLTVSQERPNDFGATGLLVASSQLIDVQSGEKQKIEGSNHGFGNSPNGEYLSYINYDGQNMRLVVQSVISGEKKKFLWRKKWMDLSGTNWLDNERLVFNGYHAPILSTIVFNPFTGEEEELLSNYPDMQPNPNGFHDLFFGAFNVVYDDSLSFALYPQTIYKNGTPDSKFAIVLFNRETEAQVANLPDLSYFRDLALWSSARQQFIVVSNTAQDRYQEEWYSIDTRGTIRQLTNFANAFPEVNISGGSLSPDGNFLAFWVNDNFFLLDLNSRESKDYCFRAEGPSRTIWSPDSKYLALRIEQNGKGQLVILDVYSERVFKIGADTNHLLIPDAWVLQSGAEQQTKLKN
jgi:hypothetical protein